MDKFGGPIGKVIFLKGAEAHKLHQAFDVAVGATVKNGQPVKLTVDGEATPAEADEPAINIVGYSIHDGKAGERITIAMKAYAVIYAKANAAVAVGPVAYDGLNTTDDIYNSVKVGVQATLIGWALDKATAAGDIVRVAVI